MILEAIIEIERAIKGLGYSWLVRSDKVVGYWASITPDNPHIVVPCFYANGPSVAEALNCVLDRFKRGAHV